MTERTSDSSANMTEVKHKYGVGSEFIIKGEPIRILQQTVIERQPWYRIKTNWNGVGEAPEKLIDDLLARYGITSK